MNDKGRRDNWFKSKEKFLDYCPQSDDYQVLLECPNRFKELMKDMPADAIVIYAEEFSEDGFFRRQPEVVSEMIDRMSPKHISFLVEDFIQVDPSFLISNINISRKMLEASKQEGLEYNKVLAGMNSVTGLGAKLEKKRRNRKRRPRNRHNSSRYAPVPGEVAFD